MSGETILLSTVVVFTGRDVSQQLIIRIHAVVNVKIRTVKRLQVSRDSTTGIA